MVFPVEFESRHLELFRAATFSFTLIIGRRVYLAYSITLVSRITFTLISPGYLSSASIRLAISCAIFFASRSLTSTGVIKF